MGKGTDVILILGGILLYTGYLQSIIYRAIQTSCVWAAQIAIPILGTLLTLFGVTQNVCNGYATPISTLWGFFPAGSWLSLGIIFLGVYLLVKR